MKRWMRWAALLLLGAGPVAVQAQTFQFTLSSPVGVPVVGPAFTVTLLSNSTPPSPTTTKACFYLSDAATATAGPLTIQTSTTSNNISFTVPASYLDASPPADLTGSASGSINATVYYQVSTQSNCDGKAVPAYTSKATITVNLPQVLYTSTGNLPQTNPALTGGKPVNFAIMGDFFAPATQVQFTGLAAGTVNATSKYISGESLVVTSPAVSTSDTFAQAQVTTVGSQGSYPAQDTAFLSFYALRQSQLSNLTVSPTSPIAGANATFAAVSSDAGADSMQQGGVPAGMITFTPTTAGIPVSGPLSANPLTLSFTMSGPITDTNLMGPTVFSTIADFNGDGLPDVLVEEDISNVYYLTVYPGGYPLGTLSGQPEATPVPAGCSVTGIATADINGDGVTDIALLCYQLASATYNYDILLANGDGTFNFVGTVDTGGATALALGDFYHHGKIDLAAIGQNSGATEAEINVYEGNGDGTFGAANTTYFTDTQLGIPDQVLTGDINGDGYPDLVINGGSSEIDVLVSNGNGTFGTLASPTYTPNYTYLMVGANTVYGVALADVNNDTSTDIVFTQGPQVMVSPLRPGPKQAGVRRDAARPIFQSAVGGHAAAEERVALLTETGPASGGVSQSSAEQKRGPRALPAAKPNGSAATIAALLNTTSGGTVSFSAPVISNTAGAGDTPIAAANFDGDCCTDVALFDGAQILVYSGDGKGDFTASDTSLNTALTANASPLAIVGTDLDGDGTADLIYSAAVVPSGGPYSYSFSGGLTTGSASVSVVGNPELPTGTYTINVVSNGSLAYDGATGTISSLGVTADQTSLGLVPSNGNPTYGTPVKLTATLTQGTTTTHTPTGSVTFTEGTTTLGTGAVNASGVATLTGVELAAGSNTITATYGGDTFNAGNTNNISVTVTPAVLTVTANNVSIEQGQAIPTLTYMINGFVNGDSQASATTGAPTLSTTATQSSAPANYPITAVLGTLAATNYTFSFVPGTLTVTAFSVSAISPTGTPAGSPNTTIAVVGPGFSASDSVLVNGTAIATTFNAGGSLSATIPAADLTMQTTLQIAVIDNSTSVTTAAVPFVVGAAIGVATTSLPNVTVNTAYSATLAATGGVAPYTWTIISGSLPKGLTLNKTNGAISGTPTAIGTLSFTVQAADAETPPTTATAALAIGVNAVQTLTYDFCVANANCPDGQEPDAIVQADDGNFYGVTGGGGANGEGAVFQITPAGAETVLYSFCGSGGPCTDGWSPISLLQASDGNFYGLTTLGGAYDFGAFFKVTSAGALSTLYSFCSAGGANCSDGAYPSSGLVQGSDGNFYGVTPQGGADTFGTAFKITPAGTFSLLYTFTGGSDGGAPTGLLQANDGNFYGLAQTGGITNDPCLLTTCGTVFQLTPAGALNAIYSFCKTGSLTCPDGDDPTGPLTQGADGNLYGITTYGGTASVGTLFKVSTAGTLVTLHNFCANDTGVCGDGLYPGNGLTLGSDGNFYGATMSGGNSTDDSGTAFQITPAGALTTVYDFCSLAVCNDGSIPIAPPIQGNDGNLYGATTDGGSTNGPDNVGGGVIYELTGGGLQAPVQMTLSSTSAPYGMPVTLSWKVLNAFSTTAQQCAAFVLSGGAAAGTWTGLQTGTLTAGVFSGSTTLSPAAVGTYSYGLTCGGIESAAPVTLTVTAPVAPTVTAITPITTAAGSPATSITINGTNFDINDVVLVNGHPATNTSYDSANSTLTATIPASYFAVPNDLIVSVMDSVTGLSNSTAPTFSVTSTTTTTLTASSTSPVYGVPLSLTATAAPAIAGGITPNYSVSFHDGATVLGTMSGTGFSATLTGLQLSAGAHNLSATFTDTDTPVNYFTSTGKDSLTVAKAVLTVTANNLSKEQGQANPALTYAITGFQYTDTPASSTTGAPTLSTTATRASPGGTYPITVTQGTLAAANYTFSFVNGTLTIGSFTLDSISPTSTPAGSAATLVTLIGQGFSPSDVVLVNGTSIGGAFSSQFSTLSATIPASDLTKPATLQISIKDTSTNVVTATVPFSVTTVSTTTALTTGSTSPTYGVPISLTATVTPQDQAGASTANVTFMDGATQLGVVASSGFSATLTGVELGAGTHSLSAVFAGDSNYQTSTGTDSLTVTKAVLTVTANTLSKQQDAANPPLTYAITGFQYSDTQASSTTGVPSLSTTATQTSPAGAYPITITQGTLAAANYTFSLVNGTLNVIGNSLTLNTTSLPVAKVGASYSATLTATGGITPYTWSLTFGSLPAGLSLNPSTGIISGKPTAAGVQTFILQVADSESPPATQTVPLSLAVDGVENVISSFCATSACPTGSQPQDGVIEASDGNLYGTTTLGGANNQGVFFRLTSSGTLTALYSFCNQSSCADGAQPAGLVQAGDGNFYGVTLSGGNSNSGTIYKITPAGAFTQLYAFCSVAGCPDGAAPNATLAIGKDGNFYGTTASGGNASDGTAFKITPAGTLTTLYSFCTQSNCNDGSRPSAGLMQGNDGNFYGTTSVGGASGAGTVFSLTPANGLTTLYSFCSLLDCTDGSAPDSILVQGANGNFFGVTGGGGSNGAGTAFQVSSAGALTTLHQFCQQANCADGSGPTFGLVLGSDGNYYGTTQTQGADNGGTFFQLTPAGLLNTVYTFCSLVKCADGSAPQGFVQASDGNFYGTTEKGGSASDGVAYQLPITPALPAPVQLSLSSSSITLGSPVTITFNVLNAFSDTMQQCNAFVQNAATGAGNWTGLQAGALTSGVYTGSATITPTAAGTYTYALTCGGVESGVSPALTVTPLITQFTLTTISPNSGNIGDPATTITLTGTGFTKPDQVEVNGVSIKTGFVNATTLKAVIPAADLATSGTLEISVFDPDGKTSTGALPYTVNIPPVSVVFSGPSTSTSASQPDLTFTLTNPYPVELTATLTLGFEGVGGADDPNVVFANGTRTDSFNIAANTTATPTIALQTGTDEGTITVTLGLTITSTSQDVTPGSITPIDIAIAAAAPAITSMTLTRSGENITVNIMGYSNTRDMTQAVFTFTGANGTTIDDPNITVPVNTLFTTWYTNSASQAFGSEFLYTQTFTLNDDNSNIGQVSLTLTNSAGISGSAAAQ